MSIIANATLSLSGIFSGSMGLASGLEAFNTLKTNAISVITTLALIFAAWQIFQGFIKKKWAELFGFLFIAAVCLYVLGGINKLQDLGTWFMKTFFGL